MLVIFEGYTSKKISIGGYASKEVLFEGYASNYPYIKTAAQRLLNCLLLASLYS